MVVTKTLALLLLVAATLAIHTEYLLVEDSLQDRYNNKTILGTIQQLGCEFSLMRSKFALLLTL